MTRIKSIEALTTDVFSDILWENWLNEEQKSVDGNDRCAAPKIHSVSATKVDEGVLSDVYRVHLEYSDADQCAINQGSAQKQEQDCEESVESKPLNALVTATRNASTRTVPPSNWLVKFCRSDLGLSWMIRNETIFYGRIAPGLMQAMRETADKNCIDGSLSSRDLPFAIPMFLSGSDQHIILREVSSVKTYPLAEGCPPEKIPFLLKSLAAWHAACWESRVLLSLSTSGNNDEKVTEENGLVFPAGMGQRLPPLQKEGLFISSWQQTIECMRLQDDKLDDKLLDPELLDFITKLCHRLATLKLRDIHEKVHSHGVTCVHGDYHISNWLFPTTTTTTTADEGKQKRKPVLVDFATTGYGNPMIDLVFFMVVSTNDETVSDSILFLEEYHRLLIECDPSLSSKISLATLKEWFPWAILCQFMILVAYDGICQDIAAAEQNKQKRESQLRHFYNVNRRMILAIRSIDHWETILSDLQTTTDHERQEAQIFCQNTALVI